MKSGFKAADPLELILQMTYGTKTKACESLDISKPTFDSILKGNKKADDELIEKIKEDARNAGVFPAKNRLERLFKLKAQ